MQHTYIFNSFIFTYIMLTLQCIYISIKYILIIPSDYCNKYMNTQTEIHRSIQLLIDLYICIAYKKIKKKLFTIQ